MAQNEYPAHEGLQVVPSDGLESQPAGIKPDVDNEKIVGTPQVYKKEDQIETQKGQATVCGIKRRTFAILVAIVVAIVIVAAVVGGVVGSKASHSSDNKDSSSNQSAIGSSSTGSLPTNTDSSPTKTGTPTKSTGKASSSSTSSKGPFPTTPLALNCPALNGTTHIVTSSDSGQNFTFDIFCAANVAPGQDFGYRNTSSLNECMQSCVDLRDLGTKCVGVVWDSIFNTSLKPPRNCFLKSSRQGLAFATNHDTSASALLEA